MARVLVVPTVFLLITATYCTGDLFTKRFRPKEEVNYRQVEKKVLDDILGPKVYDPRIRPAGDNGTDAATMVYVNIFFRSFSKIDDVKMEYSFQITLRQQWNDVRLKFTDKLKQELKGGQAEKIKYLTMTDAKLVWMPDTFFRNEKIGAFHSILTPNLYIRVFPNGDVLYSIRVSLIAACDMHLALFPFDEQTCHLNVASYGWTKDDLIYSWKDAGAVQFPENFSLPGGFKLADTGMEYCDVQTATGDYSCLRVDLTFARELSFYLVTIYIPCFMIVVVSWFSFWLDYKAVPARVALGVTTLLAMSTTMGSIQKSLPPVAYTKAVDVWSGVCTFFVFSALLEYALVNYASRSDDQRSEKRKKWNEKELECVRIDAEKSDAQCAAKLKEGKEMELEYVRTNTEESDSQCASKQKEGEEKELEINAEKSDAQRAAKQKERKEKELEYARFNAEKIEDSSYNASLDPLLRRMEGAHLIPPGSIYPDQITRTHRMKNYIKNFQFQAKKIDVFSRVLFPFTFAMFNCMYWSYYMTRAQEK